MSTIVRYIFEMGKPKELGKKEDFMRASYQRWAARELLKYVHERKEIPLLDAIDEFAVIMDEFACMNKPNAHMFTIAYDVVRDIEDKVIFETYNFKEES